MRQFIALIALVVSGYVFAEVPLDPYKIRPLLPGQEAPAFSAQAGNGESFSFDPNNIERPMLMVFYRGGWCPYCRLHLAELRHAEPQLDELGVDLVFLSADRVEKLGTAYEDGDLGYTLLSDADTKIAEAFGIAFKVDKDTIELYKGYGIDLVDASGLDHSQLPVPAAFLIGTDGLVKFQFVNPDYRVRLQPSVLMAAAEAEVKSDGRVRTRAQQAASE